MLFYALSVRIVLYTFLGDNIIEYGAQFVHGEEGNSVFHMASPHNLLVSYSRRMNNSYFYNSSGPVDKDIVNERFDTCVNITTAMGTSESNGTVIDLLVKK